MKRYSNTTHGFTLIELAIVLAITGVMIAATAQSLHVWYHRYLLDQQVERMNTIHTAIATYVSAVGHLPCPARYDLPEGDPNFGKMAACDGADAPPPVRTPGAAGRPGNVRIGAVPVRDIGLSNRYNEDPWGHRFTYAMSEDLAAGAFDETKGAIDIVDQNSNTVLPSPGVALYALADPGVDGKGAYTGAAGKLKIACPADTSQGKDQKNCVGTSTFVSMPFADVYGPAHFDDIVQYRTHINNQSLGVSCPAGQVINGISPGGSAICAIPPVGTVNNCPAGQVLVGVNTGNPVCVAVPPNPPVCNSPNALQWNGAAWVCGAGIPGPQGAQGAQGPQGPQGDAGVSGSVIFGGVPTVNGPVCPAGYVPLFCVVDTTGGMGMFPCQFTTVPGATMGVGAGGGYTWLCMKT